MLKMLKSNSILPRNSLSFFILLIIVISITDVIIAINGVTEPSKQQHINDPVEYLTKYELADEVKKCSKIRNDSDIFVLPFTTYDDPIRILVTDNIADQIISRIFGLVCNLMGYQKVVYKAWSSHKLDDFGIMQNISDEGAYTELNKEKLSITIGLNVRYLPEAFKSFDHGKIAGAITKPGHFGLYRVSQRNEARQDLSYHILQSQDQDIDKVFLERLNRLSTQKYFNKNLCLDKRRCSVLIAKDKDETEFIQRYIEEYQLRAQVFWFGEAFKEKLKELLANSTEEFFVLTWTPSDITNIILDRNVNEVKMPSCNNAWDNSRSKNNGICMFDPIPLVKFVNGMIKKSNTLNLYLERQFYFTSEEYEGIIKDFEKQNKTLEDFACDWLSAHPKFYQLPLKNQSERDFKIKIVFLAQTIGTSNNPLSIAAHKAIEVIKSHKWLKKYTLYPIFLLDEQKYLQKIISINSKVLVGPTQPSTFKSVADFAKGNHLAHITYLPDIGLSNEVYTHSLNTVGDKTIYVNVILALMEKFSLERLAILTEAGVSNTKYVPDMKTKFGKRGYNLLEHLVKNGTEEDIKASLNDIKKKDFKILFVDVEPETYLNIINLAKTHNLYGDFFVDHCVWITPINIGGLHFDLVSHSSILNGTITITPAPYGNPSMSLPFEPNKTIGEWRTEFEENLIPNKTVQVLSKYAGFVYDIMLTLGLIYREIEQKHRNLLAPIGNSDNLTCVIMDYANHKIDFNGLTGRMKFDESGKRFTNFEIWQWWGESYKEVGVFNNSCYELQDGKDEYEWKKYGILDRSYCLLTIPCEYSTITIFILIGWFLVICATLSSFYYFRHKAKKMVAEMRKKFDTHRDEFNLGECEISPTNIDIGRELGYGHYAKVFKGILRRNGTVIDIAIKQLRAQSSRYLREFLYEAMMLKQVKHENIVDFLGVFFDGEEGDFHIVMEYLENGNLNRYLKRNRHLVYNNYYHIEISPYRLTSFANDIASALCHLEKCNIVHCDLAARNVLLTADIGGRKIAKLTDFGLSLNKNNINDYKPRNPNLNPELPVRIMPPETLQPNVRMNEVFSFKSDIWSYGLFLYEIITFGGIPYPHVEDCDVIHYILEGNTLDIPLDVSTELRSLIESCLQYDTNNRPTAKQINEILTRKPDLLQPSINHNTEDYHNLKSFSSGDPSDEGHNTSNQSQFHPRSRTRTITYSSLDTSDYSDMLNGSTTQGNVPAGAYTSIDIALAENYQFSNTSTTPLIDNGSQRTDYLQMSPIQDNGLVQNYKQNANVS